MKHKTNKKGFTLIELLVVMSIIALLLSILMPALGRARAEAMLTKDQSQVKAIYSGFSFWTPTHNGKFPIPGLLQRQIVSGNGTTADKYIKGRGAEDITVNDHASLLSMSIMQNLFTPDILVAPTEQSEFIETMEDYLYAAYDAGNDSIPLTGWDDNFANDLKDDDPERSCHNSYGIMPLTGKRKQRNWNVGASTFALLGTRGPEIDGPLDIKYSKSNFLHGIDSDWKGVVAFGDGHLEILETFYPDSTTYITDDGESQIDNIFREDQEPPQAVDVAYGDGLGQFSDCILTHIVVGDVVDDDTKAGGIAVGGFKHD
jgi:prepilin-type N-terminal cleavage/methylation domain-containing protein